MRKVLIITAVVNMLAMFMLLFGLSAARGSSWMWIADHAQRMEKADVVDYDRLATVVGAQPGTAGRPELERAMGIENLHYYSVASTAVLGLMVLQTGTLVAIALLGVRSGVPQQAAAPGGHVTNG